MTDLKVLVAGAGSIGARHLEVLGWRRDVTIAATDPGPGMAAKVAGIDPRIRFFPALSEALAWGPDLVIVATPNSYHEPTALAAFAAGAHVLCEKPIADSLEGGQRMVDAAAAADRVLAVGYTERFRPAWQYVQKMLDTKAFGTLIGGRAMVGTFNTVICSQAAATNPMYGSIIVDYSHELDLLGAAFGQVRHVVCRASDLGDRPGLEARPHVAVSLLEYESGALVSVHMDYIQHPQRRLLEIYGDERTIEYDLQRNIVRVFETATEGCQEIVFPVSRNECFAAEHADIIRAIREGTEPQVTGAAGVAVLDVAIRAIAQIRPA